MVPLRALDLPASISFLGCIQGEQTMADILLVLTGVLFFIVAVVYTRACDRL